MTKTALRFQVGNNIIQSYKRLAYTPWHAIAEFVDNSTQSFFNNRTALEEANKKARLPRPLRVVIDYDASKNIFRVEDNAMGMSFEELTHALHLSKPPENTSGRSQFGMGMKTAASWLGNQWTITTKKLGDNRKYTVEIDVNRIASGKNEVQYTVQTEGIELDNHYTIISVSDHNRKFHGRTVGKIAQYLRSMYRQDFRDETLALVWRGEELNWEEVDHRLAIDINGNPYRKRFQFKVGTDSEDPDDKKDKDVRGWMGVLAQGKRRDAGLTIFHSNRVIKGWPETYRPEEIYGDERNDLLNQRLLGEIHLDGFLVSHTKDAIQWMGDQEEQIEKELKKLFMDYMRFANEPKKGNEESRGPSYREKEVAVLELETELSSNELADAVNLPPMLSEEMVEESVKAVIKQVSENASPRFIVKIGQVTVYLYLQSDMSINDRYLTVEAARSDEIIIVVNENHPHWYQIRGSEGVLNYLRHCVYDGIAEWQATKKLGTIDPDTIKVFKDGYLRIPMEMEKHSS
ncbi:MAG: ATP-binding protein [Anaerolinea sp.]|nr:ATP-binding protein [Anaerolinea sp.]